MEKNLIYKTMKEQIIKTMSENDAFTYEDEDISMAKERLDYYLEELSKLYDSEKIEDPEQHYALGDVLNIIETIKKEL